MPQTAERRREWRREYRERNRERINAVDRERKRSYGGVCEDCGAPTDGSNGREKAPRHCYRCAPKHAMVWTPERVIAALQLYYATYGECSTAMFGAGSPHRHPPERLAEFRRRFEAGSYPQVNTVQARFGSWNAGLEAAGIPIASGPYANQGRAMAADTGERRLCATEGCGTVLSRYNTTSAHCAACAARIEIAGVSVPTLGHTRLEAVPEPSLRPPAQRCRADLCTREAVHNIGSRGSYGSLCDEHHLERRANASRAAQAKPAPRVNGRPSPVIEGSRAELAVEIAQVAAQLDEYDQQIKALRDTRDPLIQRWSDLMRAMGAYDGGVV